MEKEAVFRRARVRKDSYVKVDTEKYYNQKRARERRNGIENK